MDIRATINNEHSKRMATSIRDYIGDSPELFAELMDVYLNGNHREVQRSAYALVHVGEQQVPLLTPYINQMLDKLKNPIHVAVKRNTMKILADMKLTLNEEQFGRAVAFAFDYLEDHKEAIAPKAHAMMFLWNACAQEPFFMPELKLLLEENIRYGSVGIKARARKIIIKIDKKMKQLGMDELD